MKKTNNYKWESSESDTWKTPRNKPFREHKTLYTALGIISETSYAIGDTIGDLVYQIKTYKRKK